MYRGNFSDTICQMKPYKTHPKNLYSRFAEACSNCILLFHAFHQQFFNKNDIYEQRMSMKFLCSALENSALYIFDENWVSPEMDSIFSLIQGIRNTMRQLRCLKHIQQIFCTLSLVIPIELCRAKTANVHFLQFWDFLNKILFEVRHFH